MNSSDKETQCEELVEKVVQQGELLLLLPLNLKAMRVENGIFTVSNYCRIIGVKTAVNKICSWM